MYGVEVSPGLISEVTDQVMEQASRLAEPAAGADFPIVFLDAMFVRMSAYEGPNTKEYSMTSL